MSLQANNSKCKTCGNEYTNIDEKWCAPCQINSLKPNLSSGNEKINNFIKEERSKIEKSQDIVLEWIPYEQFDNVKEICKCELTINYTAIWKDGPLSYDKNKNKYTRNESKNLYLQRSKDPQNIDELLKTAKNYSIKYSSDYADNKIHHIYGISQDSTGNYIMALDCAAGGDFSNWIKNYGDFKWQNKIELLKNIIDGLKGIHESQMVHRNLHAGSILFKDPKFMYLCISAMGLSRKVDEIYNNETKIYGVMPYVAPEVLKGKPYTQAADIYSFGMIMYFVATGRQPFDDHAHDEFLAMKICNGIRPEISDKEVPKCYTDLMKMCWDPNPEERPKVKKVALKILFLYNSTQNCEKIKKEQEHIEIEKQFKLAEEYRKSQENKENRQMRQIKIHPQAFYISRLLNPFTENLPNE